MAIYLNVIKASHSGAVSALLVHEGDSLNLSSQDLQCSVTEYSHLTLPCILHWDMNHFVVLTKVTGKKYQLNNPATGKVILTGEAFTKYFTGIAPSMMLFYAFGVQGVPKAVKGYDKNDWHIKKLLCNIITKHYSILNKLRVLNYC
jgi:ABC-type bacteriocin/lantibiotic exporter with double-glycine peptidase domain